jgi:hypothetical protein
MASIGVPFDVLGPVIPQVPLFPTGDAKQSARPEGGERKGAWAYLAEPEPGLDSLACDLRDGDTPARRFSLESRGQIVRQADCCALHTCILNASPSAVNRRLAPDKPAKISEA